MATFGERLKRQRKKMRMNQKALGAAVGVGQSTIAHYESNDRFPSERVLMALADTLLVSLDELLGREPMRETDAVVEHLETEDEAIDRYTSLLVAHQEQQATDLILGLSSRGYSLVTLLEGVLRPSMVAIGALWERKVISEATEHYATAVTERVLSKLELSLGTAETHGTVILTTPAVERHTLPLKMMHLLFRASGWRALYIGSSVPFSGLQAMIEKEKVTHVALSVSIPDHINALDHMIEALADLPVQVLLGGRALDDAQVRRFEERVQRIYSNLSELGRDLEAHRL